MHPRAGDCTGCIIGGPGERRPGRRRSCVYALGPVHHGHVTRPTWQPAALVAPDASPHPETDVPTAARSPVSSAARQRAAAPWRWPTHIAAAGRRTLLACTCYGLGDPYPKSPTRGAASRRPLRLRYSAWLEDCSLPVWTPGSRSATSRRQPRTRTRGPRCGMTGAAAAWTATPPTSSQPTSQALPGTCRLASASPGGHPLGEAARHRSDHLAAVTQRDSTSEQEPPLRATIGTQPVVALAVHIWMLRARHSGIRAAAGPVLGVACLLCAIRSPQPRLLVFLPFRRRPGARSILEQGAIGATA